MCGVEISYLPCLASEEILNFTSDDMDDIRHQGIHVDDKNDPGFNKIHIRCHNWKRVEVGDKEKSFSRADPKKYTTPMLLSIIILVRS